MPVTPPPPLGIAFTDPAGNISVEWSRFLLLQNRTLTLDTAPADARYLTLAANPSLTDEFSLGSLSAGWIRITVAGSVATVLSSATLPATDLTGTLPTAVFPNPLPALSGVNLTALNGSNIASGTVALARGGTGTDLSSTGGTSQVLKQASSGAAVTVAQLASTDISGLVSSTYTPTLTNVTNLDASTAYSCQYLRVGSVVTVSGRVDVDPTAAGATQLGISLPVASNFANANECAGAAFASAIAGQGAAIRGDATNDRAEMIWTAVDVTNQPMFFSFTYRVI